MRRDVETVDKDDNFYDDGADKYVLEHYDWPS